LWSKTGGAGIDTSTVQAELTAVGISNITLATSEQVTDTTATSNENYLDVAFLAAADKVRFGKLIEDLEKDHTKGRNNYPMPVTSTYNLVVNY
jgi:hypothetical protein